MDQGDKGNRISSDGRNTWNRAGLIPGLFALQYRDIVQNLLKDLIWQKGTWDQLNIPRHD